jgi:hypothetical protein
MTRDELLTELKGHALAPASSSAATLVRHRSLCNLRSTTARGDLKADELDIVWNWTR